VFLGLKGTRNYALFCTFKQKKGLIELLREKTNEAMGIKKKVKSNKNPKSLKKKRKRSKRTIRKRK